MSSDGGRRGAQMENGGRWATGGNAKSITVRGSHKYAGGYVAVLNPFRTDRV